MFLIIAMDRGQILLSFSLLVGSIGVKLVEIAHFKWKQQEVLYQCVCKNIRSLMALFSIKLIHNLYLFLFHCIQNRFFVLLSTEFIKIWYKLIEIRSPKVNINHWWQSRLTKTQNQNVSPSWFWLLVFGQFFFWMIQKF